MNEILSKNLNALRNDKLKTKLLAFINGGGGVSLGVLALMRIQIFLINKIKF
ncbi:hypothetical protein [Campylobacter helveticus]|uniref:hypothetical protein n=1 Tax=Campylobacter helveticus TaxID=28898 RepID=UPI0013564636|nr:hypothetical protein [Campylobacter helveticus]